MEAMSALICKIFFGFEHVFACLKEMFTYWNPTKQTLEKGVKHILACP